MKYNLKSIMNNAWKLVRKLAITMSEALKIAWANAKTIATAKSNSGISEEMHTWAGWHNFMREVIHESVSVLKVTVIDPTTKKGTKILSYFTLSQTHELGTI